MKIVSVHLAAVGNSKPIHLDFRDASASGRYLAKAITGLDADEIFRKFYSMGSGGSGNLFDMSLVKRDIVIRAALNPRFSESESYSSLRDDVYKLISASRTAQTILQLNGLNSANEVVPLGYLSGHISKVESPFTSKESEVQITFSCDNPLIKSIEKTDIDVGTLLPLESSFTDNISTAPHGLKLDLTFVTAMSTVFINDSTTTFRISAVEFGGFKTTDTLRISSELGDKYLFLVRPGSPNRHLIDKLEPGSVWPMVFPGENTLIRSNGTRIKTLSHVVTYWGV